MVPMCPLFLASCTGAGKSFPDPLFGRSDPIQSRL
jgi:hypothetical protein